MTTTTPERVRNRRGEGGRLREQILEAAGELLSEKGPEAVTLRAVARRVGIAAPSIYGHFADRELMLFAVVERAFALLHAELQAAADAGGADPAARLRAVCTAYLDFAVADPALYRVMFGGVWSAEAAQDVPAIADRAAAIGLTEFEILRQALVDCVAAGVSASADADADAAALWTGLHGLASLRPATPMFPWPESTTDTVVDRLAVLTGPATG